MQLEPMMETGLFVAQRTDAERQALKERAVAMHQAGQSRYAISKALGVSTKTLRAWLPGAYDSAAASRQVAGRRDEVLALHAQGLTGSEIARRLGISRARVAVLLGNQPGKRFPGTESVVVRLAPEAVDRLLVIADQHRAYTPKGPNVGKPSLSVMLDRIAAGELKVVKAETPRG
jgi:transposase